MIWCSVCDRYHSFLANCPALRVGFERAVQRTPQEAASLPPTAEQTSIARFNALADQIRELEKSLKQRQDQDREAISSWTSLLERELSAKLDRIEGQIVLLEKATNNIGKWLFCNKIDPLLEQSESRAVAKKKAAPLVGKKGTGRKG